MRHALALLIAATAAATTIAAPATAQVMPGGTAPMMLADGALLDIAATGKVTRTPDVATIRSGVVTQAATADAALRDNAQRMDRVIAALKSAGTADRDITTSNVSLQPQYRYGENQPPVITGYQATNNVSIRFRDIARSGAVLDALVKAGANQIDGPTLSIDKADAALDEARTAAIGIARRRAALYAQAAGLRVDRIVSISEDGGNDGPTPRPMAFATRAGEARDAPSQILPGEQDVSITVAVRFLLK